MRKTLLMLLLALLAITLLACDVEVHVHTWGEPEIDANGNEIYTCTECSKTKSVTKSHTHTWGEPVIGANGEKTYTCDECGQTKTEAAAHEHDFAREYTYDSEQHWNACTQTGCGEKGNLHSHTWNAGEVTKEPSEMQEGERTYTCTACGYTKTEAIAKLLLPMPRTEWETAFTFENVKVESTYPEDEEPICYFIDGELAQTLAYGEAMYTDPSVLIEEFDFSAYYDDFIRTSENVYTADRVEVEEYWVCVDVVVNFADGKIVSVAYAYEDEEDVRYTYCFSEWGEIEVTLPTLSAADLTAAFAPENFENYTVGIAEMTATLDVLRIETWQFDGEDFGYFLIDEDGITPEYGTASNAGWVKLPELAFLATTLDASLFVYDVEMGGFFAEVMMEDFMGSGEDVVGVCMILEDGLLVSVMLLRADDAVLSYYFTEYGTTVIETVEEVPELSAQELKSALDPAHFENYAYTYTVVTAAGRVTWRDEWEFDGKSYHNCTYDNTGEMVNEEYEEIAAGVAGWDCFPILWELTNAADSLILSYDADAGLFYSEVNDPGAFGGEVVELYLLVEDGYLTHLELVNGSDIHLVYVFTEYGAVEIAKPA